MQEQPPRVVIGPDTGPGKVFPTVGVTLSQLVFWANNDTRAHLPAAPGNAFIGLTAIQPGTTSNTQAPGNAIPNLIPPPGKLKQGEVFQLHYTCSLHEGETGILELVNDFFPPSLQLSVTRNPDKTIVPVALITGGKPPYSNSIVFSELPATVTVVDGGSSGPTLSGTCVDADRGTFLLRITIQDALSNLLDSETFQITIS